jgi:hypothetical protein
VRKNYKINPAVLICFGLFFLWGFGWETVGHRLLIDVDGVIVASRDVPSTGAPRYATEYTIRGPRGEEQIFWAGPTDASLPRSLPVGTQIRKRRWHLDFEYNGTRIGYPEMYFYDAVLACGFGMVVWGVLIWRKGPE